MVQGIQLNLRGQLDFLKQWAHKHDNNIMAVLLCWNNTTNWDGQANIMNAQRMCRAATVCFLNFAHPDYHSVLAMSSCPDMMSSSPS